MLETVLTVLFAALLLLLVLWGFQRIAGVIPVSEPTRGVIVTVVVVVVVILFVVWAVRYLGLPIL